MSYFKQYNESEVMRILEKEEQDLAKNKVYLDRRLFKDQKFERDYCECFDEKYEIFEKVKKLEIEVFLIIDKHIKTIKNKKEIDRINGIVGNIKILFLQIYKNIEEMICISGLIYAVYDLLKFNNIDISEIPVLETIVLIFYNHKTSNDLF